jgi:hypothetical protein
MTARKEPESIVIDELAEVELPEPEVAVVIDPTPEPEPAAAVVVNPYSAQPAPHLKPQWDEPELDPTKRYHIGDDPDGSKNAAVMAAAIARHQDKAAQPPVG